MKHKASSLNLNYLNAKMLTLNRDPLLYPLRTSKCSFRAKDHSNGKETQQSKNSLPSVFKPQDPTCDSFLLKDLQVSHSKLGKKSPVFLKQSAPSLRSPMTINIIKKYRQQIIFLQKQNSLTHHEIRKICQNIVARKKEDQHKPVRTIEKSVSLETMGKNSQRKKDPYANIYQQSVKQSSEEVQKTISSNFLKSFQSFLARKNRRVPQFLRKIR